MWEQLCEHLCEHSRALLNTLLGSSNSGHEKSRLAAALVYQAVPQGHSGNGFVPLADLVFERVIGRGTPLSLVDALFAQTFFCGAWGLGSYFRHGWPDKA